MKPEIKKIMVGKWPAMYWYNANERWHTLAYFGTGGALIGGTNYKKVQANFKQAMQLGDAIDKLMRFKITGFF